MFEAALVAPQVVSLILRSGPAEGRSYRCVFEQEEAAEAGKQVRLDEQRVRYQVHDPRSLSGRKRRDGGSAGTLLLKASMAGRVVRVVAEVGAPIEAHGGVLVIEAMKMQNEIRSPRAGRVLEVRVSAGEMVNAGQVLAVIE